MQGHLGLDHVLFARQHFHATGIKMLAQPSKDSLTVHWTVRPYGFESQIGDHNQKHPPLKGE
jgi:hypothetical protein